MIKLLAVVLVFCLLGAGVIALLDQVVMGISIHTKIVLRLPSGDIIIFDPKFNSRRMSPEPLPKEPDFPSPLELVPRLERS